MGYIILYIITGIITSCYYFSFSFTFLPAAINTKMILATVGAGLFGYRSLREGGLAIRKEILIAAIFAMVFSLICYLATDINYTADFAYATYFVSFITWLGGAYAVCALIRALHGKATFKLITYYLAITCFGQCILALLIDNIPAFQQIVDTYVDQGQSFFTEVNRLYGIGAALDNAGVRFSLVLVMIAALLCKDEAVRNNRLDIALLLAIFFTVGVIGNMISRTTILGVVGGLLFLVFGTGLLELRLRLSYVRLYLMFGSLLLIVIALSAYLYEVDAVFRDHMRFAFEGFFNWVEKGEWRTDSTDKLNRKMWIWPLDAKTWIIGTGLFDNWIFGTDIGYCRFILYCGLSGFIVFSLFFVYNAMVFAKRFVQYRSLFLVFLVLTFTIWLKVSTDIFLIYALFYCLDIRYPVNPLTRASI